MITWVAPEKRKEYLKDLGIVLLFTVLSRLFQYLLYLSIETGEGLHGFYERANSWDSAWYGSVVSQGYNYVQEFTGQANWAFFPLYPLTVLAGMKITGLKFRILGPVISLFFFALHQWVALRYAEQTGREKRIGWLYVFLLNFGVYTFIFHSTYTESLFLFILSLTALFWKKKKYIACGLCGALLTLTRNVGVMIVFFFLTDFLMEEYEKYGHLCMRDILCDGFGNSRMLLGVALTPLGLFGYMLFLRLHLGDALAFLHVQIGWGGDGGFLKAFRGEIWDRITPSFLGYSFLGLLLLFLLLAAEKHRVELSFPLMVFLSAVSVRFISLPRYMIGTFFLLLCFCDWADTLPRYRKILCFAATVVLGIIYSRMWYAEKALIF